MKDNIALKKLIEQCDKIGAIILHIDYSKNIGLIEQQNGTPTSIVYIEEKGEWY